MDYITLGLDNRNTFLFTTESVYKNIIVPIHTKSKYKQELSFICTHTEQPQYFNYGGYYTILFRKCINIDHYFFIIVLYNPLPICYHIFQLTTLHHLKNYSYGVKNSNLIKHPNHHQKTPVEIFLCTKPLF
jgi:hypothetical protein